jgi:chemotaxis protein CheX
MPINLDAKGRTVISLDESLDVTHAASLARAFMTARGKDILVDASRVNHLGAQCSQILLSAKRTWALDGHVMRVGNPSPAFNECFRLLGLTSLLPIEEILQ